MKKYDVIIIGAGLSGCVLGYLLKKQNKKVLIIEQKDMKTKSKLCGGLVTSKAYTLLGNIYSGFDSKLNFIKYDTCCIVNKDKKIELNDIGCYAIYRKDLDDFVLSEYLNMNGEIIDNTTYSNINTEQKELTIHGTQYYFDYLVGADGILSQVRRDVTHKNQKMAFALEDNITENKHRDLEIYFFDTRKGYGWIIPNSTYHLVGICEGSGKTQLEKDYINFLKQINANANTKKGAFGPTGNDILLERNKNIKFVGDAAGLIAPITGEGIYYAIASAKILSEDLDNYATNMKQIVKRIREESVFTKFVYNHKVRNFIFNRHNNWLFKRVINAFAKRILH